MNIIVCLKQVPNTTQVRIDPVTNTLIRDGVPSIMNPFDRYALEQALLLRDVAGGTVTAISMGPPQAESILREALAMGADGAYLVSDRAFGGSDTLATSYILAAAVRKLGDYDLILCGRQAIDGDTGQVGPELAEHLGLAQVTYAGEIRAQAFGENGAEAEDDTKAEDGAKAEDGTKAEDGATVGDGAKAEDGTKVENSAKADAGAAGNLRGRLRLTVTRELSDSREVLEVRCPAIVTVTKNEHEPRFETIRGRLAANRAEVRVLSLGDLALDRERIGIKGSPTRVKRSFVPERHADCDFIEGESARGMASQLYRSLAAAQVL